MCWRADSLDPASASSLRREIAAHLERNSDGSSDLSGAAVIVGELLANAARYAPGPVCVALDWRASEPTFVIQDTGPGFEPPAELPPHLAEGGRGLYIVSWLANRLVAERAQGGGMRICVTLPVKREEGDEPARPSCPMERPFTRGAMCEWPLRRRVEIA